MVLEWGLNIVYYVRAYATNSFGTVYGNQQSFTSLSSLPTVTTTSVTSITGSLATSGGDVVSDGGSTVTIRGVCWSTLSSPTTSNSSINNGTGIGSFVSNLTNLTVGTTYYLRAFATNSVGTSYGVEKTFTSTNVPTVITSSITNISGTSGTSGGNVISDGNSTVTARGVCWSTSSNPTISDSHTTNGTGTGSFISNITGLINGTIYHVRAYATNSIGTSYGADISFTTMFFPIVTTISTSYITGISAKSGGNVSSAGSSSVTARGVCWSTSPTPTTANSHTTDGTGIGSFTSDITGLVYTTTYYVRAYATNSYGTSYGNELSFTTLTPPTVTTSAVTEYGTTADSGGNVTSMGSSTVTARGVCWATWTDPNISNSPHTIDGSGSGVYSSTATGLSYNTLYYLRAYATSSVGTSYGSQVSFTTSPGP